MIFSVFLPTLQLRLLLTWWRHQMETFSALLAICAGNSPVPGEFPTQRPVTRSFDVYFDLRPDKRLSKQSWGWWFETLSHSLWRHRNVRNGLTILKKRLTPAVTSNPPTPPPTPTPPPHPHPHHPTHPDTYLSLAAISRLFLKCLFLRRFLWWMTLHNSPFI